MPTSLIALLSLAALAPLGTELRQDGFAIRPPQEFRMARMDLYRGTEVGAVGGPGFLSAALLDRPGEDGAAMLVASVEGSFSVTPAARDELSTAVMRHLNEELGMPFAIERVELVLGSAPRIEVLGSLRQENQLRQLLVAAMPGEGRHAVVTFSVPSGRFAALAPLLRSSLESFRAEAPTKRGLSRGVAGAAAGALAGALLASIAVWRRRSRRARPG